jgi:hypothetical protein
VEGVIGGKWKDPYGMDEEREEGGGPESYREVVQTKWNIIGTLIFLYYCAAIVFYFVYRATYTLNMGITWWVPARSYSATPYPPLRAYPEIACC